MFSVEERSPLKRSFSGALGAVALVALVAGVTGCNSTKTNTPTSSTCGYEIAFFGALTGSASNLGINIEQSVELALAQYNAKHGQGCVSTKKFDSQGDPAVAPGLARQLVTDTKIIGVVGPLFSGESAAANPIFEQAGVPLITPSATNTALASKGWKVFHRAVANDDTQAPAAGNYIKNVLKAKKVFVADDQSVYGAGLADSVKTTLGALVAGSDKTAGDGKQTDFSATVQAVVSSGADVFFYGGFYQNAGLLRKQLTAAGWKGIQVGGDGINDPGFAQAAGNAAAEGTIALCPCSPSSKAGGTFLADYKAKFGTDSGTYSDVAFDVTNLFLAGLDAGKVTSEQMNTYLSTATYQGVANTYRFTATGELDPAYIKVWAYRFGPDGKTVPDQEAPKA